MKLFRGNVKLNVFSDIHLEKFCPEQVFDVKSGDILVLAGDILNAKHLKTNGYLHEVYRRFLNDCSRNYEHVIYVKGNHEFYGYNYESTHGLIQEHLPSNFHLMENDTLQIGKWTFIGMTLWTNFRNENPLEMLDAQTYMNDYKSIHIGRNYRKLNTNDTLAFNLASRKYLQEQLSILSENVIVVSHMAPSYQSVADRFKRSANGAFVNDLDDMILAHSQIKFWLHGHTHTFFDYPIGECRVICNPYGYPGQETGFNPNFQLILN